MMVMAVAVMMLVMAAGLVFFGLAGGFLAGLPILLHLDGNMGDAMLPTFPADGILQRQGIAMYRRNVHGGIVADAVHGPHVQVVHIRHPGHILQMLL